MLGRDYLDWLWFTFGNQNYYDISLFEKLSKIEYRYQNSLDRSRMCAGLQLRQEYAYEIGVYEEDVADGLCSVLEMLCALGREMYIQSSEESPQYFVCAMLTNLGIRSANNPCIQNICNDWMDNNFRPDGKGSIFYVSKYDGDMRELSIWDQMNVWLTTYYPNEKNIFD